MAAPLILAGKAAMDFSSGMVDIAQKANLSQDQTNAMAQGILRAAQAAHQMPEAMRQGVDALSGFGIDPREAMQMIGPIGRLGTAMKVDIADGAAAASANLQNLKVGLGDTGKALDIMAAGGNVGAFEVRDMARYFPSLTAQAQALGQSGLGAVADLTAALEIARRGAGTSEEAATNIANLLAKINSPTVTRAFAKNFGVDLPAALKAAYAQGKTPMEALAAITQKATGGDLSKLGLVVEDMQAQSALRTLILNMDDYRKIRADLGKSGGTVQAAFAQREALDASVAWQSFTGTMSALAITLGATLLPSVTQFFGWVNTGVSAIARWAQANPELAGQIMTLASAFIAGRMALGALQFGFGSALSGLATLRNGFMMARTAAAFLIGARLDWPRAVAARRWPDRGRRGDLPVPRPADGGLAAINAAWDGAPAWMRAIGGMMMDGLLNALIPGRLASRLLEIAQAG
jgi:TP901 family phage tail tape measure protein